MGVNRPPFASLKTAIPAKKSKKWPVRVELAGRVLEGRVFGSWHFLFESWEIFLGSKNASQIQETNRSKFLLGMEGFELWRYFIVDVGCVFCFFVVPEFSGGSSTVNAAAFKWCDKTTSVKCGKFDHNREGLSSNLRGKKSTGKTTLATQRN